MSLVISKSSNYNNTLKSKFLNPRQYEEVMTKYLEALDKWFIANSNIINKPHSRMTHFGIIDVVLKNEKGKVEQDFSRTMVYFGRWENATLFKGQAVSGIELGMLWLMDSMLDLWYKFVPEHLNGYDDVVGELHSLRDDLVGVMERYTYINLDDRKVYSLPASKRRKPPNLYHLEFYDVETEYAGAIFEHINTQNQAEVWSDDDKRQLADALASDLVAQWIRFSEPTPWFKSKEDQEKRAEDKRFGRELLNNPIIKRELAKISESFRQKVQERESFRQKVQERMERHERLSYPFESKTATAEALQYETEKASEARIAQRAESREQQKLYEEMKHRVSTLEQEAKALGSTPESLKKCLQDAVEANFRHAEVKKEVDHLKDTRAVGGPPNRDLILDSPPELITMNIYQEYALLTANQGMHEEQQLINAVFGLSGEAGEVADLMKKRWFHPWSEFHHTKMSEEKFLEHVVDEIGDVQWYLAWIAKLAKTTLGAVAKRNRAKLVARHKNGNPNAKKQNI